MKAFIFLFTLLSSRFSNYPVKNICGVPENSASISNLNSAELLPESLYSYMYKSYGKFRTALLALDFQLTSNNIISDEMSGSGQIRTAVYSNNYLQGGQKIIITTRIPADRNQIERITSISSYSNCDFSSATGGMGSRDANIIWAQIHKGTLMNYGFRLFDAESDDGFTHLYRGTQADGNFIECRFGCGDGEFTMQFYNAEDD